MAAHKTFVSYHHANDQAYKNIFNLRFGNKYGVITGAAVELGDLDPNLSADRVRQRIRDEYLRDASVTVVLIGTQTWQRKHIDWEIAASIRDTALNPRGGLLGILLPSYQITYADTYFAGRDGTLLRYDKSTIPPRLHDNIACGYAKLYTWSDDPDTTQDRVHEAYLNKSRASVFPDNARIMFGINRSGAGWHD